MTRPLLALLAAVALTACGGGPAGLPPPPKTPPPVSSIGDPGPPVDWGRRGQQLKIAIDTTAHVGDCPGLARLLADNPRDVRAYIAWQQRNTGCTR